jgi:hypothetical protein
LKKKYKNHNFMPHVLERIKKASEIVDEYAANNLTLNLRQLHYTMVSRGLIDNTPHEYKKIGDTMTNARLAGLIDWDSIEDRHRTVYGTPYNGTPQQIIESAPYSYNRKLWENQENYVEVWIEKDALSGVLTKACNPYAVSYFACKGYTSISMLYEAAQRIMRRCVNEKKKPVIIHLGDHDPSGIDMTRDVFEKIRMFLYAHGVEAARVHRIALNMPQIEEFNLPPNPVKVHDPRFKGYFESYGEESWELDAIEPMKMVDMIQDAIKSYIDLPLFEREKALQEQQRNAMIKIVQEYDTWEAIVEDDNEDLLNALRHEVYDGDELLLDRRFLKSVIERGSLFTAVDSYEPLFRRVIDAPKFVERALDNSLFVEEVLNEEPFIQDAFANRNLIEATLVEWDKIKWLL